MLPNSSLPSRDARVGPLSPSAHNDGDYSDDDIRLVAEIVTLGDAILPTLPERDQLPTTALFEAAEQILPEHGYDAENAPAHIDRLIFKIGGQRSGKTLGDKFKTVLAGMNIRVEYDTSSPQEQSPAVRPPFCQLYGISDDETGNFDFSPRPFLSRRHSLDSRPSEPLAQADSTYDLPIRPRPRPRSTSPSDIYSSPGGALSSVPEHNTPSDVQSPPAVLGLGRNSLPAQRSGRRKRVLSVARLGYSPSDNAAESYADDEGEGAENKEPKPPVRLFDSHPPTMDRVQKAAQEVGPVHDNKELLESPLIIPKAQLQRVPRTGDSEDIYGANAATAHRRHEQIAPPPRDKPPAENTAALVAKLNEVGTAHDADLLDDCFSFWHHAAKTMRKDSHELRSFAIEYDNVDMVEEVFDIWLENTIAAQEAREQRLAAAEREEYVRTMERRAARVYEIVTISAILEWWQDSAREEADRTAVARRHLVRKRAFDGWRAQHIEDESKVTNFILMNALQKWGQVALHHEVRQRVAVQRYHLNLASDSLDAMWTAQKHITADFFWAVQTANHCLDTWSGRTAEIFAEEEVAAALDERLMLTEVMDIWREETKDLQYTAYALTVEHLSVECQRTIEIWHEQARLQWLLEHYNANKERNLQVRALNVWHAASVRARRENRMADILVMDGPFEYWKNAAHLRRFQNATERQEKAGILRHWYYEERLAWFRRYSDNQEKRGIVNHLLSSAQQLESRRVQAEREADYVLTYYRQAGVFDAWLSQTGVMWRHHHNANLINLYRTTKRLLDTWRESRNQRVVGGVYYGRQADRLAARGAVATVFHVWPRLAEQAKRERMMTALRNFRRNYKVKLARSCTDTWWLRTSDAIDNDNAAHALHIRHRREEITGFLRYWDETTQRAQYIREVAALAEIEVYWGLWKTQVAEAEENELDAIDFDAEKTAAGCWKIWEFQTLQVESLKRTAAAVKNRNDNRFCGQILDGWHQAALPDSVFDLQMSTMSRRSIRNLQLTRSMVARDTPRRQDGVPPTPLVSILRQPPSTGQSLRPPETPQLPVSQLGFARVGGSVRFARTPRDFGPMEEFDEDDDSLLPGTEPNDLGFMSTPTRRTGSARPLGYRPTTTPSALLSSPHERELRREYTQSSRSQPEFSDIREESLEN